MISKVMLPQKNLEDFCKIYAKLSKSRVENHDGHFSTYHNPGFFYARNFIYEDAADYLEDSIQTISEQTKNGYPHLTTCTLQMFDEDIMPAFADVGFTCLLKQYGMIFEHGTQYNHTIDPHISMIDKNTLDNWISVMIEGFRDENKQREDIVYETMIKNRDVFFFAYRQNDTITGTAMMYLTEDYAGITEVAVPGKYRKQGVATRLINHILQISDKAGCPGTVLQASAYGRPLYQKLGFTQVSEIYNMILQTDNW